MAWHRAAFVCALLLFATCTHAHGGDVGDVADVEEAAEGEEDAIRSMVAWLFTKGVDTSAVAVRVLGDREYGRGIVARRNITRGEVILRIPFHLQVRSEYTHAYPYAHDMERVLAGLNRTANMFRDEFQTVARLTTFLFHDLWNTSSPWAPYYRTMPRSYTIPYFWTPHEMAQLRPRFVQTYFRDFTQYVLSQYRVLDERLYRHYPHVFLPENNSFDRFRYALAVASTRSWGALAHNMPLMDMLNHSPDAYYVETHQKNMVSMYRAYRNFTEGEEIMLSYGRKRNIDLIRMHGFVMENNPADYVDLALSFDQGDAFTGARDALFEHMFGETRKLPCKVYPRADGISHAFWAFAVINTAPPRTWRSLRAMGELATTPSAARAVRAWRYGVEVMEGFYEALYGDSPTTLAEDEARAACTAPQLSDALCVVYKYNAEHRRVVLRAVRAVRMQYAAALRAHVEDQIDAMRRVVAARE